MNVHIRYIVGDKRRKLVKWTPTIEVVDDDGHTTTFVASEPLTRREAVEVSRFLVAGSHQLVEAHSKPVRLADLTEEELKDTVRDYDE